MTQELPNHGFNERREGCPETVRLTGRGGGGEGPTPCQQVMGRCAARPGASTTTAWGEAVCTRLSMQLKPPVWPWDL